MIDSMDVKPSDVVRDLGVLLDSELIDSVQASPLGVQQLLHYSTDKNET